MLFSNQESEVEKLIPVLIIEDEPILRSSMVRGLSKLNSIELFSAGSLAEAAQIIERVQPQLTLSDLNLPDGVGVEVLQLLDSENTKASVVFISAYVEQFSNLLPTRSNIEVFEKPLSLHKLRTVVEKKLSLEKESEELPFALADYIQLACIGQHSIELVLHDQGNFMGKIIVHEGQLWSAINALDEGKEAFNSLIFADNLAVHCNTLKQAPGSRNITGHWEGLLLDAARTFDEGLKDPGIHTNHSIGEFHHSEAFISARQSWTELLSTDLLPSSEVYDAIANISEMSSPSSEMKDFAPDLLTEAPEPAVPSTQQRSAPDLLTEKPVTDLLAEVLEPAVPSTQQRSVAASLQEPTFTSGEFEYQKTARRLREYQREQEFLNSCPPSSVPVSPILNPLQEKNKKAEFEYEKRERFEYEMSYQSHFAQLVDEGVEALLCKDYQKAVQAFRDANTILPGQASIIANLKRLQALGYGEET